MEYGLTWSSSPSIVNLSEMQKLFDFAAVVEAVKAGLIAHSRGAVLSPMPGQLIFPEFDGDCHIKFGRLKDSPNFVIKVATGFYRNAQRGLPVNGGCVLVLSAETGNLQTIFLDEGWLTAWRTVAAGYLASVALASPDTTDIAIIGTGHQARLHAQWLSRAFPRATLLIAGRSARSAERLAAELRTEGLSATAAISISEAVSSAKLILTATASRGPLFDAAVVRPGTHITAVGADTPGKQELDPKLLAIASVIAVDDLKQCADHGELGCALRANLVSADKASSLGDVLSGRKQGRPNPTDITIADLTGIPAQDIAIASWFLEKQRRRP